MLGAAVSSGCGLRAVGTSPFDVPQCWGSRRYVCVAAESCCAHALSRRLCSGRWWCHLVPGPRGVRVRLRAVNRVRKVGSEA